MEHFGFAPTRRDAIVGLAAALTALHSRGARAQDAITLGVLTNPAFTPTASIPATAEAYGKAWAAFEKQNSGVKLKPMSIVGGTDAIQEVLAKGVAGQLPDVGIVDTGWLARLQHSGYLQPIDDVLGESERGDFLSGVLASGTLDGKLRAIPFYNAWRGLYYRPSAVKKLGYDAPPTDWKEFLKFGEAAKRADYQYSIMFPATKSEFTAVYLLPVYFGLGGELYDATGAPAFYNSPNRDILERVLGMWRELVVTGNTTDQIGSMDEAALRPYFYSRQTLTVGASSSNIAHMLIDDPSLAGDLAAATLPMPDGARPVPLLQNWAYVLFTTDPARQAAAKAFIKYMMQPRVMGPLDVVDRRLPVQRSIWNGEAFYTSDPLMRQIYQIQIDPRLRLHSSNQAIYPAMRDALTENVAKVIAGTMTPREAVDRARDATLDALKRL